MRAERAGQVGGLVLGLLVVGWLLFAGDDEPAREAGNASEASAQAAAAREAERLRLARARADRRRAIADGRTHGRDADEVGEAARRAARGAAPRPPEDDGGAAKGPLGKSHVMPIHLNSLLRDEGRAVVEISGLDPEPPRELIAWRLKDGKYAILVRGESDETGRLDFPPVVAAGSGLEVVITGADSRPELPGASEVQSLAARPPEPPQGRVLEVYEEEAVLRVVPVEAGGAVLIADLDGTVFARYPISRRPAVGTRAFDVALELYGEDAEVLVAHELSDGRRSEWRALSVSAPTELDALPESEDFEN